MTDAHQNILEIVRVMQDTLRKSDRKVAAVILADPSRFLSATVAETAMIANVSQPTVIRFCAAIGCSGFQDFRLRLAQALALGTPATHSVLLESDGPATVFDKIFDYTITSLDWARNRIDKETLSHAVEMLVAAKGIEFFGFGASGIVAQDAQQKFPLFGIPCGAQTDAHQQIMTASLMGPGQVAVVISNTGSTRSIIEIADLARGTGAKVIGLIGNTSPLMAHCDVTILIETLDNTDVYTPTISRIAALTVIDVLSTAVAMRRDPAQRTRIAAMKQQLRDLRSA
nr:SIS domain-containing protein [uncultured Dongia sp.]